MSIIFKHIILYPSRIILKLTLISVIPGEMKKYFLRHACWFEFFCFNKIVTIFTKYETEFFYLFDDV